MRPHVPALLALALAGMAAIVPARAARKTVCTITVNSADEKEAFRRRLPRGGYDFVELVRRDRDDWLRAACEEHIQCDVLLVSGHFNAGETFYSDKAGVDTNLKVDELERASCSDSCPALFSRLKEVYLFGCESLNPDASKYASSYGESGWERMRRIFAHVPAIYGFSSHAPLGATAAMLLGRYFDRGGARWVGTGRRSRALLSVFGRNSMTMTRGVGDTGPGARERREVCQFFDARTTAVDKLRFIHGLLRDRRSEPRRLLERIERWYAGLPRSVRDSAAFRAALAQVAVDEDTRARFLAAERRARPASVRQRMIVLAQALGWLTPRQRTSETLAMVDDVLARRALGFGDVDLVCRANADGALDGRWSPAAARAGGDAKPAPGRGSPGTGSAAAADVAHAAARACLGSAADRREVLAALATPDTDDVRIAQLYLRYRPIADPAQLRAITTEVARMPPSQAQLNALGALARLHVADRGVLEELARAFARSRSVRVQRAIAEIFMRSDPQALPKPDLLAVLREHRVPAPDGRPDLIDALIRSLQS